MCTFLCIKKCCNFFQKSMTHRVYPFVETLNPFFFASLEATHYPSEGRAGQG
jgi:hypothetical protein